MSISEEPYEKADIRMAEVIWSKNSHAEVTKQHKYLTELAATAETGLILDCAFVDVANSELLNLLVRVRTHAKKQNKGFALFNVPENLRDTIKLCNMNTVLPIADNMIDAKKLAYDLAHGKGGLKRTIKRIFGK